MMCKLFNPAKEVPSLELCKRLRELGYPQEGGGWYYDISWYPWVGLTFVENPPNDLFFRTCFIKAPTLRELGEWLPSINDVAYPFCVKLPRGFEWYVECVEDNERRIRVRGFTNTESNARAEMLIWLVENGFVKFQNTEDKEG